MCKHCQKAGHQQENCFQLKTCYHWKRQGHIARHCRSGESINKAQGHEQTTDKFRMRADKSHEPEQSIEKSTSDTKEIDINHTVHAELEPSSRILLNVDIGRKGLKFLYDLGSQYSMLPLNIFQQLANKPPLTPINRAGMGISGVPFKIDGVTVNFKKEDNTTYNLEYEPVLVSSDIKNLELRLKEAKREHDAETIIFVLREGQNIKLKYFVERVATSSAFIQVTKTTLIPDNTVQFIKGKVKELSKSNLLQKEFFFERELSNEDIEIPDLQLGIDNRNLRMPIISHSGKDIFLKKGQK